MFNAKRILVAVDFSPESTLALDWAILIAKQEAGASIELCHVVSEEIAPIGPDAVAFEYSGLLEEQKKAAENNLKGLQNRIPKAISSSFTIGKGGIAREIERLCKEKAIDLVIMTTQGRRGLARFLQGSTTEETVRLTPCPVLVLHLNRATVEAAHAPA